jgi:anthranilate/para-aminobenzoate synthase component I
MPIEVVAPLDVLLLASCLAPLGDLAVLRSAQGGRSFVAAGSVARLDGWLPDPDSPLTVPSIDDGNDARSTHRAPARENVWASVPRWIGLLPYEAARALEHAEGKERTQTEAARHAPAIDPRPAPHHVAPTWRRYPAVVVVDHDAGRVTVVGDDAEAEERVAALLRRVGEGRPGHDADRHGGDARLVPLGDEEPPSVHEDRIREALQLVRAGDLYQVNLARRLRFSASGDPLQTFSRLVRVAPTRYGFYCDYDGIVVAGSSPELFLEARTDGSLLTVPIKGTRPRGSDAAEDLRLAHELAGDPKERAELLMVIDLERNDFGRVAEPGSVRVPAPPRVERFPSLFHRLADVRARLRPDVSRGALLAAMFPSGSVTGAPKRRAMQVIADLEADRRGLYTGAYGYVGRDGRLVLSIAIRTLTIRAADREAHYHTGGGIVWGSDPVREVEETRVKALQVAAMLSGENGRRR